MFTIKEVPGFTGLSIAVVRKLYYHTKPTFKVLKLVKRKRTEHNQLYFEGGAQIIWQKIRQHHEQDKTPLEIAELIADEFGEDLQSPAPARTIPEEQVYKNIEQPKLVEQTQPNDKLLERIEKLTDQLDKERAARYQDLEKRTGDMLQLRKELADLQTEAATLKGNLKLLPEGKTPEEIRKEWEVKQKKELKRKALITELVTLGAFQKKRRKEVINELNKLDE